MPKKSKKVSKPTHEQHWSGSAPLPKPSNKPARDDMEEDSDADENMD